MDMLSLCVCHLNKLQCCDLRSFTVLQNNRLLKSNKIWLWTWAGSQRHKINLKRCHINIYSYIIVFRSEHWLIKSVRVVKTRLNLKNKTQWGYISWSLKWFIHWKFSLYTLDTLSVFATDMASELRTLTVSTDTLSIPSTVSTEFSTHKNCSRCSCPKDNQNTFIRILQITKCVNCNGWKCFYKSGFYQPPLLSCIAPGGLYIARPEVHFQRTARGSQ